MSKLMDDAERAINKVFGDTSVSKATTRRNLEGLQNLIEDNLMGLSITDEDEEEVETE